MLEREGGPRLYAGRGVHGDAVETLGRRVASGAYAPGEVLLIDSLGAELGISRTAVRETLKVLAAKGMVDSRPKRGTIVRERSSWNLLDPDVISWQHVSNPTLEFLADLSELRFIVEPAAARLAALRRTDEDLRRLGQADAAMSAAGNSRERAILADLSFHRALLLATHNELLTQLEPVIEAALRARDELVHGRREWPDPLPSHRGVLEAVRAADPDEAARRMELLLEISWRDAELALRERAGASGAEGTAEAGARAAQGSAEAGDRAAAGISPEEALG